MAKTKPAKERTQQKFLSPELNGERALEFKEKLMNQVIGQERAVRKLVAR